MGTYNSVFWYSYVGHFSCFIAMHLVHQIELICFWPPHRIITFGRGHPVSLKLLCSCRNNVKHISSISFVSLWDSCFISGVKKTFANNVSMCGIITPVFQMSLNKARATLGTETEWVHRAGWASAGNEGYIPGETSNLIFFWQVYWNSWLEFFQKNVWGNPVAHPHFPEHSPIPLALFCC